MRHPIKLLLFEMEEQSMYLRALRRDRSSDGIATSDHTRCDPPTCHWYLFSVHMGNHRICLSQEYLGWLPIDRCPVGRVVKPEPPPTCDDYSKPGPSGQRPLCALGRSKHNYGAAQSSQTNNDMSVIKAIRRAQTISARRLAVFFDITWKAVFRAFSA